MPFVYQELRCGEEGAAFARTTSLMRWLQWIDAACAAACHSHPPPDGHCCKLWAVWGSNIKESHLCKICVCDVCLQGRKALIICWKTEGDKKEFENRKEATVENESVPRWVWSCTLAIFTLLGAVVYLNLPAFSIFFHNELLTLRLIANVVSKWPSAFCWAVSAFPGWRPAPVLWFWSVQGTWEVQEPHSRGRSSIRATTEKWDALCGWSTFSPSAYKHVRWVTVYWKSVLEYTGGMTFC